MSSLPARVLFLCDRKYYSDCEEVKKWVEKSSSLVKMKVRILSLELPRGHKHVHESEKIMAEFRGALSSEFRPHFVICKGRAALCLMLLLMSGTPITELASHHLLLYHSVAIRQETLRRVFFWEYIQPRSLALPLYFTVIPYFGEMPLGESLSRCADFIVSEEIRSITYGPPAAEIEQEKLAPLVAEQRRREQAYSDSALFSVSITEHEPAEPGDLSQWKNGGGTFHALFFMFNSSENIAIVCGRRDSDGAKVFQVIREADPGVFVGLYSTPTLRIASEECFVDCEVLERVPDNKLCHYHMFNFCHSPDCLHGADGQEHVLARVPFHERAGDYGGVPRSVRMAAAESICHPSPSSSPPPTTTTTTKGPVRVFNQHYPPVTRFQMKNRLYFSSGDFTKIHSMLKVGHYIELGPHFTLKGFPLARETEHDLDMTRLAEYDIIYVLSSAKARAELEREIETQWTWRCLESEGCFPVSLVNPLQYDFDLERELGTDHIPTVTTTHKKKVMERLRAFTETKGTTFLLIHLSQAVGLCSLGQQLEDLERTTLIYTKHLCESQPEGVRVLVPTLRQPADREKGKGGTSFNTEHELPNEEEAEEAEEADFGGGNSQGPARFGSEEVTLDGFGQDTNMSLGACATTGGDLWYTDPTSSLVSPDSDSSSSQDPAPPFLSSTSAFLQLPSQPPSPQQRKRKRETAFSKLAARGIYFKVEVLDFSSDYPRQIINEKISPERSGGRRVLVELIESLLAGRRVARHTGNKPLEFALKLLANKTYGWVSYYFRHLGDQITAKGRESLSCARSFLTERGMTVFFGDTDSLFTNDWNQEKRDEIIQELNEKMLAEYGAVMEHKGSFDLIVSCQAKKSYLAFTEGEEIVGSSMFQDMPSKPAFFRELMKRISLEFVALCKDYSLAETPEKAVISFTDEKVYEFISGAFRMLHESPLDPMKPQLYASKNALNMSALFPWENDNNSREKEGNKKMIMFINSCTLSGCPVYLDSGYIFRLETTETQKKGKARSGRKGPEERESGATPMFVAKKLPAGVRINEEYMHTHYFLKPLAAMISRALGMTKDEMFYKLRSMKNSQCF